ncbi:DHH family phosphoesterase [Candidatus Laterigemmans baculatus]|uniref:DHH family phosphoesterase n=1 Tax=Candidatus Laterigemmans baculatus TaxID=2770505 RepID=UPI0013D9A654|nr:DHH family phosphoesterase [Candidatus Laterigemmans baculatus]
MIAATMGAKTKRSAKLLTVLEPFCGAVVVMHDNPDPDAIASGWAIKYLLENRTNKPVRLIGGGAIVRAENRQMVKLLSPPIELLDELRTDERTAAILVDCGLEATNHLLGSAAIRPVAVIDHHAPLEGHPPAHRSRRTKGRRGEQGHRGEQGQPPRVFFDVRPHVAASATIAATYLREQGLEPPSDLATALLYAIRTETRGSEWGYSRIDRAVLPWLTRLGDPSVLAEIEEAPLTRGYFSDLVLGLQNTFVYGDAAFCMLPHAEGPETVGELGDLLIRCEGIQRVLCGAVFNADVLLSARTARDAGNATLLLQETIRGLGHGGGHLHRAGGKLAATAAGHRVPTAIQDQLRRRWLRACGVSGEDGEQRLIDRNAIIGNLV